MQDEELHEPSTSMATSDIIEDIEPPEQEDNIIPQERSLDSVQSDINKLSGRVRVLQDECESASNKSDPETLSVKMLALARINSRLGRLAKYAHYLSRNSDRGARRERAGTTLEYAKEQAVNKAQLQAELDSREYFALSSYVTLIAEQADDLCFRTDTFLKLAQSRLSLIKGDIQNGRS